MSLKQRINEDLKQAMREGDSFKRDALRMLSSMIKNMEIEKQKREEGLSDAEVQEVISRAIKQRKDSAEQFKSGGRIDLVEKETQEIDLFFSYMPIQLTEEKIREIVREVIREMEARSKDDIGKVMGHAMQKLTGNASGDIVRRLMEEELK